jgi:DNA polymerase-1
VTFGFLRSLRSWVQQFRPSRVCVVWDDEVENWRKLLVPGYKDRSDRKKKLSKERLDGMFEQREWLHENLGSLGVHSIKIPKTEADDIIALLARSHEHSGRCVIVSGDRDFDQIVTDRIHIYRHKESVLIDTPGDSSDSLMLKCIEGDSSDNIPGVEQVGAKTIETVRDGLKEAGKPFTLENIQEFAAASKTKRIRRLSSEEAKAVIERNLQMIDLNVGMAKLPTEKMVTAIRESSKEVRPRPADFSKWVQELAFNSITNDISSWHADFGHLV